MKPELYEYRRARKGVLTELRVVIDNGPNPDRITGPVDDDPKISWPLEKMIRSTFECDKCRMLLEAAARYRRIYDSAYSEAELRGVDLGDDLYRLEQRTWENPKTGDLVNKGAVVVSGGDHASTGTWNRKATDKNPTGKKTSIKTWKGDVPLLDKIDSDFRLSRLRLALGMGRQPFEDGVVHGMTANAIGKKEGFTGKQADAVGKAYLIRGLHTVVALLESFSLEDKDTKNPPIVAANDNGAPKSACRAV